MSEQTNISSLALHDILLSIADSLNQAQNQLNNVQPYDEYGRPNIIYHLPYLDFNLQVTTEFENSSVPGVSPGSSANAIPSSLLMGTSLMRFRPIPPVISSNNTTRIESSISGRFVAVVPNEGLPQMFINCYATTPTKPTTNSTNFVFNIYVQLKNANNENIANTRVEFNFDATQSNELSPIHIINNPVFSINEGLTDQFGKISAKISINEQDFIHNCTFCFVINTGSIFNFISVSQR